VRRVAAFLLTLWAPAGARAEPQVDALVLGVRVRDATPAARALPAVGDVQRAALGELLQRSWIGERWVLAGATAAITIDGGGHPLPNLSRVLLLESGDRAELIRPGAPHVTLPPRVLGDLFEGGLTRRTSYVAVSPEAPSDAAGSSPWRLVIRQQSRTARWHRMVTTRITVWHRKPTPAEATLGRLAVDLIALPHLGPEGRLLLRREGAGVGLPQRWRVEVEDESLVGRNATPVLEGEVLDVAETRVPESTLRAAEPAYYAPVVHDAGRLLGDRELLSKLRTSDDRDGPLAVANRTPFHLYLLLDGTLVALVGPNSQIRVDGLAAGYYRLYARTRHGTFAWGPRDQYVPGVMTVAMP